MQEDSGVLVPKFGYERFDTVKQKDFEQVPEIVGYIGEEIKQDDCEEHINRRPIEAASLKSDGDDRKHFHEIVVQSFSAAIVDESVFFFQPWAITIYELLCHLCSVQSPHDYQARDEVIFTSADGILVELFDQGSIS